jgi:hypothetical protein
LLPQAAVRRHQAMGGLRMVGIIDILIILLVTIGPTKAAAMYLVARELWRFQAGKGLGW